MEGGHTRVNQELGAKAAVMTPWGRAETDRGTAPNGAGPLDTRGVPKDQEGTETTGPAAGLSTGAGK